MKKFISIDVGIKNLSFCFFSKNEQGAWTILKWDNIDLTIKETKRAGCSVQPCKSIAAFQKDNKDLCCKKHAKKHSRFLLPTAELSAGFLKKQKKDALLQLATKWNCLPDNSNSNGNGNGCVSKEQLLSSLQEFVRQNVFDKTDPSENAKKMDLVTIGKNLQHKFDVLFQDELGGLEGVIIENQIGPLANKMKTLQGMIAQYFIMRGNPGIKIECISAVNKLKDFEETSVAKCDYKERKKLGVAITTRLLQTERRLEGWCTSFNSSKKKDDLSDCFLQGEWYIRHNLS